MKGITWGRDSHGLFDYESRHLTKRTMKTLNPAQITRLGNELEILNLEPKQTPTQSGAKPLLNIINDNGTLFSAFPSLPSLSQNSWCLVDQFYLECCTKQTESCQSLELNELMFLVVRSLKKDNQKIVRKFPFLTQFRRLKIK